MATTAPLTIDEQLRRAKARQRSERRWWRAIRIGCLPVTLIGALLAVVTVNGIAYLNEGYQGILLSDSVINLHTLISLQALFLLQLAASWIVGLGASILGTRAAAARGGLIRQRAAILQGRVRFWAWAILALRVWFALIAAFGLAWMLAPTLFGREPSYTMAATLMWAARYETITFGLALFVGAISWLFGPFLRLRYSLALGALAATWSRRADERFWLAISARLWTGMLGAIAAVWGSALANLVYFAFQNPNTAQAIYQSPSLWWPAAQGSWLWLGITALLTLYMCGQAFLPPLFLRAARFRLAHRLPTSADVAFLARPADSHDGQSAGGKDMTLETSPEAP